MQVVEAINPAEKRKEEERCDVPLQAFESVAREWVASNIRWTPDHAKRVLRYFEVDVFSTNGGEDITKLKVVELQAPIKALEKAVKLDITSRLQQRTTNIMHLEEQNGLIDTTQLMTCRGSRYGENPLKM